MNILLINDSPIVNNMIQVCLQDNNSITTTSNSDIDIPSDTDLIIFDVHLNSDNIINSRIPCLMLGTEDELSLKLFIGQRISQNGTNATYINKPFNCEQLNAKVSLLIS